MIYRLLLALALLSLAALPLAAEELRPDADRTETNTTCDGTPTAWETLNDDPQSPGNDWCTSLDNNNNQIRVEFESPTGDLSTSTDAQTFRLYVRRDTVTAPGNGEPIARMDTYNDTSLIETGDGSTITSDTGELVSEAWTASAADGSAINVDIVCTAAGGGPNKRSCDYDAVEWDATLATGEEMMIIGQIIRPNRRTK